MFTLTYPLSLPEGRSFHSDARAIVPPLMGNLRLTHHPHNAGYPVVLIIEGFDDQEAAAAFADEFGAFLRCASLSLEHGFRISDQPAILTDVAAYDGNSPTIFRTDLKARPYWARATATLINHLVVLANEIVAEQKNGSAKRLREWPELATAVRLYAESSFAGGETARFVVLLSALEVLIPVGGGAKRSQVVKMVGDTLRNAGRIDEKSVRRELDQLYVARNALLHEAIPVSQKQIDALSAIVRDTLRCLVSA
ncbi:hypothetical protein WBP06_14630 [Novosphingobium sp. BL-8H]|uniref:hypothetical protein n=1 Tax=Novosphingobium sp. BL-8H TaxID=3127640 RepID=UPI0037581F43